MRTNAYIDTHTHTHIQWKNWFGPSKELTFLSSQKIVSRRTQRVNDKQAKCIYD